MYIDSSLTLFADTLILYNISPKSDYPLYIQNNCLEIVGESTRITIPVIGNVEDGSTSKIICNTTTGTVAEFCYEVEVYEMEAPGQVTFRGATTIIHLKSRHVVFYGGNALIENLNGIYEYCYIYLENMASVNIQHIYSSINQIDITLTFGKIE